MSKRAVQLLNLATDCEMNGARLAVEAQGFGLLHCSHHSTFQVRVATQREPACGIQSFVPQQGTRTGFWDFLHRRTQSYRDFLRLASIRAVKLEQTDNLQTKFRIPTPER